MSRIKRCIMGVLFLAIVMTGIYFYQDSSNEVQAETQVVNKDMLSLKFQVGQGTAQGKIRVVASVDSPNYSAVGFDIAKDNNEPQELTIDTKKYPLPQRIKSSVEGMEYSFSPKVVDTSSEYFLTGKWTADTNVKYTVCAWVKTFEGDKICGQSRCITLNDLTTTEYLNMSFELNEGCTLSKTEEDAYADINVTYNGTPTTAKVISVNGSSVHVNVQNVDRTTLPSATKFVFKNSDDTECGSTIFRNLYTSYSETTEGETTTNTADTSWYDVYLEENKDEKEFVIATSADLYGMSVLANPTNKITFEGKTIYLCADIEANKGEIINDTWDKTQVENGTDYMWTPIGRTVGDQDGAVFNGIFDGQGHTISGLYAELTTVKCNDTGTENGTALFAWTDSSSVLKNFQLVNSYLGGTTYNASIVSRAEGNIDNVDSDAIVKGSSYINGGIVANTYGEIQIKDCNFTGNVTSGTNFAGGIVGTRKKGDLSIVNCTAQGTVCAPTYYSGGILGGIYDNLDNATITVENCKFTGNLENTSGHSGGIIGSAYDKKDIINVTKCSVEGTINAGHYSGGFIGQIGGGSTTIKESDFAGELIASNYVHVGGFVGKVIGGSVAIDNSNFKETGKLVASETAGGLVGYVTGGTVEIDESSFAGEVASDWCNGGLVSRVATGTVEIKNSSFEETGKLTKGNYSGGFIGRVESGTVNIDACRANSMTAPGSYSGGIIGYVGGGNATVKNTYFEGAFNTTTEYAGGLVGYSSNGTVNIVNSYFSGQFDTTAQYAGGLVGYSSGGTVNIGENSYFDGTFSTTNLYAGGLVGYATASTLKISESHFNGTLDTKVSSGDWAYAGGLLGYVIGSGKTDIENSYFDGTLNSTKAGVGGVVGFVTKDTSGATAEVTISRSYSKGAVDGKSSHTGGLVGGTTYLITEVSLTDCLNEASVTGTAWVGGLFGRTHISNTTSGNVKMTRCLNTGTVAGTNSVRIGSAVGKAEVKAPEVANVYAVTTESVNQAYGSEGLTFATTTCALTDITVGNGVTAEKIKTEILSGLFGAENTIWTIGTTEGSTPKLDLTK